MSAQSRNETEIQRLESCCVEVKPSRTYLI